MKDIKLIYTHFSEPLDPSLYHYYLGLLPENLRDKNGRYRRWQDRHTHLFGKVLLLHLADVFGLGNQVLNQLRYTQHDRPYLATSIDFNISHTGTTVACAMSEGVKIGLDIEQYSDVDFSDFQRIHSKGQWDQINASQNLQKAFFEYWTIKESVIKADGKGLSIPLDEIGIDQGLAWQGDHTWHLQRLDLEEHLACCVACDQPVFKVNIEKITLEQIYARSIC